MTNLTAQETIEPVFITDAQRPGIWFTREQNSSARARGTLSITKDLTRPDGKLFIHTDPDGAYLTTDEAWSVVTAMLNHMGASIMLIDGARVLTAVKPNPITK